MTRCPFPPPTPPSAFSLGSFFSLSPPPLSLSPSLSLFILTINLEISTNRCEPRGRCRAAVPSLRVCARVCARSVCPCIRVHQFTRPATPADARTPLSVRIHVHFHVISVYFCTRPCVCAQSPCRSSAHTRTRVHSPPLGSLGSPQPRSWDAAPSGCGPERWASGSAPNVGCCSSRFTSPQALIRLLLYIFFLFLPRELPFVALVPSRSVKGAGFEVSPPLPEEVFATLCRSCWHFALRSRLCGCSCDGASSQRLQAAPPAPQPSPHVAPTQHGATCTDSG